nr:MAG TPA: hypothetical protein [Caudoviricetes sp.]
MYIGKVFGVLAYIPKLFPLSSSSSLICKSFVIIIKIFLPFLFKCFGFCFLLG